MKATLRESEKYADEASVRVNKRVAETLEEILDGDKLLKYDQIKKLEKDVTKIITQSIIATTKRARYMELWDAQRRSRFFRVYEDDEDFLILLDVKRKEIKQLIRRNFQLYKKSLRQMAVNPARPLEAKKQSIRALTGERGESGLTYRLMRILRTETNRSVNEMAQRAAKECKLTGYIYCAMLDDKVCSDCKKLDGKLIEWKDSQIGVNLPPIHPNCRCYTIHAGAVISERYSGAPFSERGYLEWKREFVLTKKK